MFWLFVVICEASAAGPRASTFSTRSAASQAPSSPSAAIFARITRIAAGADSTRTACTAPRESASSPTAPLPAYRSMTRVPSSEPSTDSTVPNSPSRARSLVGRVARPAGTVSRRPPATPAMTRVMTRARQTRAARIRETRLSARVRQPKRHGGPGVSPGKHCAAGWRTRADSRHAPGWCTRADSRHLPEWPAATGGSLSRLLQVLGALGVDEAGQRFGERGMTGKVRIGADQRRGLVARSLYHVLVTQQPEQLET
jgi:hypothetical protein